MSRLVFPATIILVAALNSGTAEGADIILRCESPDGKHASYGTVLDLNGRKVVSVEDGIRWVDDEKGYPEMYPVFVWREAVPDKLLVSLGTALNIVEQATVTYR